MRKLIIAVTAAALLGGSAVGFHLSGDTVAEARASSKSIVDAAKRSGDVAERIDGYLVAASGASSDVRRAVDDINIQRKNVYTNLARQRNVAVSVVAQLSGEKQIADAAPGAMVIGADGQWRSK